MPLSADEQFHVRCAIERLSGRLIRVQDANAAANFLRRLLAAEPAPVVEAEPLPVHPTPKAMWLTYAQARCLAFIEEFIRDIGTAPTFEEMMVGLNLNSKSGVSRLVKALVSRNRIRATTSARSIVVIAPLTETEKRL